MASPSAPHWKRTTRRFSSSIPRIVNNNKNKQKRRVGSILQEGNLKTMFQPRTSLPPMSPIEDRDVIMRYIKAQGWDMIVRHLALNPKDAESIFVINESGFLASRLPIHEACRYRAPISVIKALVDSYPDSVRCRDSSSQFLPIHFACRYGSSAEVVEFLVNKYPQSITKDGRHEGTTPYALASRNTYHNKDDVLNVLNSFDKKSNPEKDSLFIIPGRHSIINDRQKIHHDPSKIIEKMEVSSVISAASIVADWDRGLKNDC